MAQLQQGSVLEGKTALVTGAGRGIGRATALALAGAGAKVFAVARTASDLDEVSRESGGKVEPWVADVRDADFLARIEAMEDLDILVNNAGGNRPKMMVDVDDETLDWMLDLNIRSVYRVARAAARAMTKAGRGGVMVNMSSQMGHVGSPKRTVYCMTKHAVEGLTKAMAVELGQHGIRVNTVCPTFIETPMTKPFFEKPEFRDWVLTKIKIGRIGVVEDIMGPVVFLASDAAALMTGSALMLDGGWTAE
jgi:NAD(P)-dependent dehydrogenase (short-subunit alcohol dehydrogenase family)